MEQRAHPFDIGRRPEGVDPLHLDGVLDAGLVRLYALTEVRALREPCIVCHIFKSSSDVGRCVIRAAGG